MNETKTTQRRVFLRKISALGAIGVTSAVGGVAHAALSAEQHRRLPPLHKMTAADFSPLIGSWFRIYDDRGDAVYVRLTEVCRLPSAGARPRGLPRSEAFVTVFEGRGIAALSGRGRTYRVEHARLGRVDLFFGIVPDAAGRPHLESVFN